MPEPTGTPKRVAKVTIEAPVVSFRYPHFLIGRQPTFDVPPPSTIFGHIASALGEWPDQPVEFAYAFSAKGRASDLEHQHILNRKFADFPGKIQDPLWRPPQLEPGKKSAKGQPKPRLIQKTTESNVQPHQRDFLFDVRLELYVNAELADAFRSPVFTVVLGRSQDLASVQRVEVMDLQPTTRGYLERTILPADQRKRLPWGVTTLMPRYIGPAPERRADFAPYIVLKDPVFVGGDETASRRLLQVQGEQETWWMDPTTPEIRGGHRLLWFHRINARDYGYVSAT